MTPGRFTTKRTAQASNGSNLNQRIKDLSLAVTTEREVSVDSLDGLSNNGHDHSAQKTDVLTQEYQLYFVKARLSSDCSRLPFYDQEVRGVLIPVVAPAAISLTKC